MCIHTHTHTHTHARTQTHRPNHTHTLTHTHIRYNTYSLELRQLLLDRIHNAGEINHPKTRQIIRRSEEKKPNVIDVKPRTNLPAYKPDMWTIRLRAVMLRGFGAKPGPLPRHRRAPHDVVLVKHDMKICTYKHYLMILSATDCNLSRVSEPLAESKRADCFFS